MDKTWQIELSKWLVQRLYGDDVESDTFYGDFIVRSVGRLSGFYGEKMVNQIIGQSSY